MCTGTNVVPVHTAGNQQLRPHCCVALIFITEFPASLSAYTEKVYVQNDATVHKRGASQYAYLLRALAVPVGSHRINSQQSQANNLLLSYMAFVINGKRLRLVFKVLLVHGIFGDYPSGMEYQLNNTIKRIVINPVGLNIIMCLCQAMKLQTLINPATLRGIDWCANLSHFFRCTAKLMGS